MSQLAELEQVLRDYVAEQKKCGCPAGLQDLREFRRWKNMPSDGAFDSALLLEINGEIKEKYVMPWDYVGAGERGGD